MKKGISLEVRNNPKAKLGFTIAAIAIGVLALGLYLFSPLCESLGRDGSALSVTLIRIFSGEAFFSVGCLFALLFIIASAVLAGLGYRYEQLGFLSMLCYFLAGCLVICSASFYDYAASLGGVIAGSSYSWGLIVSAVLLFLGGLLEMIYLNKIDPLSIGEIAEMGVLIAMAIVLDMYVSIDVGPTGGSLNFAIIPLYLIALRSGPAKGFIAGGIVFGFITCLTDGYGFYFFPFDYLIGWGSIAVIGLFRKKIFREEGASYDLVGIAFMSLAILLSTIVRMIGSGVSSIVYYGYSFWAAIAYNTAYCLPTAMLGLVAMVLLFPALRRVNLMFAKRAR